MVVGDFRLFVHLGANSVAHILTHDIETGGFHIVLHGHTDGIDIVTGTRLLDADIEALLRDAHELAGFLAHLAHREGARSVAHKTFKDHAHVDADDVPFLKQPRGGETVDHLLVDRAACGVGVAVIAQKGRFHFIIGAHVARQFFKAHGRFARLHDVADGIQDVGHHTVGLAQAGDLPLIFDECALILLHDFPALFARITCGRPCGPPCSSTPGTGLRSCGTRPDS